MDSVQLRKEGPKRDLHKCIFCCKSGPNANDKKLSSTPDGRLNVITSSQKLKDNLLYGLTNEELNDIKYHRRNCCAPYLRRASRVPTEEVEEQVTDLLEQQQPNTPILHTLRETRTSTPPVKTEDSSRKNCVICNHVKHKNETAKFRISEDSRAKNFIKAYKFIKDDVYTRCIFFKTPGDIYAADLYTHKSCIKRYIKRYLDELMQLQSTVMDIEIEVSNESETQQALNDFCSSLQLDSQAYELTKCRDEINAKLNDSGLEITNKILKSFLITRFGDKICFTYPSDRSVSSMFFASNINAADIAETVRKTDEVSVCAKSLREECKAYDFSLQNSYKDADDLSISYNTSEENRPVLWNKFFKVLFQQSPLSSDKQRVCDTIFQITYSLIHNNTAITPLTIGLAQAIHDTCRSKKLLMICNRLGLITSNDTIQRIDTSLAQRMIDRVGQDHRVPVPPAIESDDIINGAQDNFDKEDGSHDTILMLFQNRTSATTTLPFISRLKEKAIKRKLPTVLPCQKLLSCNTGKARGDIPADFIVAKTANFIHEKIYYWDHWLWLLHRYTLSKGEQLQQIPSFSSMNSILSTDNVKITTKAFTPILPYPATDYDAIYTNMINFQDVLKQKNQPYGSLWCDEGVYHIAKELQFLNPTKFKNIFLGLGGFHLEKIVLAAIGLFLEKSGARDILVMNEIYGPTITDTKVMTGKDYVLSREGMRILHEAINRMRFAKFENERQDKLPNQELVIEMSTFFQSPMDEKKIRERWDVLKSLSAELQVEFKDFTLKGEQTSENFKFWNIFLDQIMPVIIDLTRSFREGNWSLYLSALRRAIPLFFAFGRTNYCRWAPIHYEDCLNLETHFPLLHKAFSSGNFVVHHTHRRGSGTPIDQALEQDYNKPAKGFGGVVGYTKRKEAVAKWNLIKNEKTKYTCFMENLCGIEDDSEYSLHHEFSKTSTEAIEKNVMQICEYLENKDLFKEGNLINIANGEILDEESKKFYLGSIDRGEERYIEYRKNRIEEKNTSIFKTISQSKIRKPKNKKEKNEVDIKKDTMTLLRSVDIARARCYDIKKLLSYEMTTTPHFLVENGFLRSNDAKSKLLDDIRFTQIHFKDIDINNDVTVIDFMAYARKLDSRMKNCGLKTFGDFLNNIWKTFERYSRKSKRIDIIFDNYFHSSVKSGERMIRANNNPAVKTSINRLDQPLPPASELPKFWACDENKIRLQQFFISWIEENYDGQKPLYLGGCHMNSGEYECFRLQHQKSEKIQALYCTQEEADHRIAFHISHAILNDGFQTVLVCSGDTDVYVGLLYNFKSWQQHGLQQMWTLHNEQISHVHESFENLPLGIINILPAVHVLSGCDTTSKIGTKKKAFIAAKREDNQEKLLHFGSGILNDEMIKSAEKFLLDCIATVAFRAAGELSFDDLRHHLFHQRNKIEIDKLPCTSSSLRAHIKRAYLETYKLKNAAKVANPSLNPPDYGYILDENLNLHPDIDTQNLFPDDFPHPCTCLKCAKVTVCVCRVAGIACCDFCKCKRICRNKIL